MTRRAVRRGHRDLTGSKRRHASAAGIFGPGAASSTGAGQLHLGGDTDEFLARWWRATRMGRSLNTAKN